MHEPLKILVLGFDPGLRRTFAALLAHQGYEVIQATTIPEALESLRFGWIDLLLVDFTVRESARQQVIAEAARRRVRALALDPDGTGMRITHPHAIAVSTDSPRAFLVAVEEALRSNTERIILRR